MSLSSSKLTPSSPVSHTGYGLTGYNTKRKNNNSRELDNEYEPMIKKVQQKTKISPILMETQDYVPVQNCKSEQIICSVKNV